MIMVKWQRLCLLAAGLGGAMAVGFAALSAHGMDGQAADWLERGSRFQLIHAVALLVLGLGRGQGRWLKASSALFLLGSILFSGSLYAMALASLPVVYLVPAGGTCFILGWLALAIGALSPGSQDRIT
jgi:uncharacterized membrane protein YgdD (TMEM256/DUF423 family)